MQAGSLIDRLTFLARADGLDRPGFYRLRVAGSTASQALETALLDEEPGEYIYAVNPPAESEGDLRSIDLTAVMGGEENIVRPDQIGQKHAELVGGAEVSRTLLYIVLALCLVETYLAQRFGHFRE